MLRASIMLFASTTTSVKRPATFTSARYWLVCKVRCSCSMVVEPRYHRTGIWQVYTSRDIEALGLGRSSYPIEGGGRLSPSNYRLVTGGILGCSGLLCTSCQT